MDYSNLINMIIFSTATGSVMVALIFLIKAILGRTLKPAFHYYIWFLLLIRLIIPYAPQSPFSIYNLFFSSEQNKRIISTGEMPGISIEGKSSRGSEISSEFSETFTNEAGAANPAMWSFDFKTIAFYLWLFGAGIMTLYTLISLLILHLRIRPRKGYSNESLEELFNTCLRITGTKRRVRLICTDRVASPSLYGLIVPKVLIPINVAEKLNEDKLKYIILHELSHLKRRDLEVSWITTVLRIIHWFNPVIRLGLRRMQQDCEVSCDALALSYLEKDERIEYGNAVVNTMELVSDAPRYVGALSMAAGKEQIKRRVTMITKYKKLTVGSTIFGASILLTVSALGLTNGTNQLGLRKAPVYSISYETSPEKNFEKSLLKQKDVIYVSDYSEWPLEISKNIGSKIGETEKGDSLYTIKGQDKQNYILLRYEGLVNSSQRVYRRSSIQPKDISGMAISKVSLGGDSAKTVDSDNPSLISEILNNVKQQDTIGLQDKNFETYTLTLHANELQGMGYRFYIDVTSDRRVYLRNFMTDTENLKAVPAGELLTDWVLNTLEI